MDNNKQMTIENEYSEKLKIKVQLEKSINEKIDGKSLKNFDRIASYMKGMSYFIDRGIISAHLDFEPITSFIAEKKDFYVISGRNPSGSFTLGHLSLLKLLLELQQLGATIVIPFTNDESFIDGKNDSFQEGFERAYESMKFILAMGFDPQKTKVFVHTRFLGLYKISMYFGNFVKTKKLKSLFGNESINNASKVFYRGALQLSSILMLQLENFGGSQHTLVPVGIDQHPYILLARDVAKKADLIPPSELVLPYLLSNYHPLEKMSSSKPGSAIRVNDPEKKIREVINGSYTGSLSTLEGHKKYGGIPEICPIFQILRYHHPDSNFVCQIEKDYRSGELLTSELKSIVADFVVKYLADLQMKAKNITEDDIKKVLLNITIDSF